MGNTNTITQEEEDAKNISDLFHGITSLTSIRGLSKNSPPIEGESDLDRAERMELQDVAQTSSEGAGLGFKDRIKLKTKYGENKDRHLDETYGVGNWSISPKGKIIIRKEDGSRYLADETNITYRDFTADAVPVLPAIVGSVAAMAATPPTAGIAALSLAGALGSLGLNAAVDAVNQVDPLTLQRAEEIFKKRGFESAIEFVFGVTTGGLYRMFKAKPTLDVKDKIGEIDKAVTNIEAETGVKIPLTAAQRTGSSTLGRTESIAEKMPFSSETFLKRANEQETALRALQNKLKGNQKDLDTASGDAVDEINAQYANTQKEISILNKEIDEGYDDFLKNIGDGLNKHGDKLNNETASIVLKSGYRRKRADFRENNKKNYSTFDESKYVDEKIVEVGGLKLGVKQLLKDYPEEIVEKRTINELGETVIEEVNQPASIFLPKESRAILESIENLDNMTVTQARNARKIIHDLRSQDVPIPGVSDLQLVRMSKQIDEALDDAVRNLPDSEVSESLKFANEYYKDNVQQFLNKDAYAIFRTETAPNYVDNASLFKNIIERNDVQTWKRLIKVLDPNAIKVLKRSVFNELIESSQQKNFRAGILDVDKFYSNLKGMSKNLRKEIFGDSHDDLVRVVKLMDASQDLKHIDMSRIAGMEGSLVDRLRRVAHLEKKAAKEYETKVIKPFLRGDIGETSIDPEEFVINLINKGSSKQMLTVIDSLSDKTQTKVRQKVIELILNKSARNATADDVISGTIQVGDTMIDAGQLSKTLSSGLGEKSINKFTNLIGEKNMQLLRDLGVVRASQQRKGSAAGGLLSGMLVSGLLTRMQFANLIPLMQYKAISVLLSNQAVAKGLAKLRLRSVKDKTTKLTRLTAVEIGMLADDIIEAFPDEQERYQVVNIIEEGLVPTLMEHINIKESTTQPDDEETRRNRMFEKASNME